MKKFILTRVMQYTERAEVEAERWEDAKEMLKSDAVEFEAQNDDMWHDSSIKFTGDIDD